MKIITHSWEIELNTKRKCAQYLHKTAYLYNIAMHINKKIKMSSLMYANLNYK